MSKHQGYSTLGALVGGAVVGFLVFGYLGMRFFKDADGPLLPLACASVGAVVGAVYQVAYGDLLWHRLWGRFK
jgi:hypothetical protein